MMQNVIIIVLRRDRVMVFCRWPETKLTDFYAQRVKKNRIKDGDKNTSYFHKSIVKIRRRNTIVSVKGENDVIQFMPNKISNTFVNYFRHIFASQNPNNGRSFLHTR
jgi:hypothetical protein